MPARNACYGHFLHTEHVLRRAVLPLNPATGTDCHQPMGVAKMLRPGRLRCAAAQCSCHLHPVRPSACTVKYNEVTRITSAVEALQGSQRKGSQRKAAQCATVNSNASDPAIPASLVAGGARGEREGRDGGEEGGGGRGQYLACCSAAMSRKNSENASSSRSSSEGREREKMGSDGGEEQGSYTVVTCKKRRARLVHGVTLR